jgi:hypothetical protein
VADEVERLARIAGMLGSAHEGERATAAQMASAMSGSTMPADLLIGQRV